METPPRLSRLAGTPGIGPELFLEAGGQIAEADYRGDQRRPHVTEFLGHGANLVTGDYSRGASGMWIVNGEWRIRSKRSTVAGNLKEMFCNISEIGSDLESGAAWPRPTIRMDGLTIGGE